MEHQKEYPQKSSNPLLQFLESEFDSIVIKKIGIYHIFGDDYIIKIGSIKIELRIEKNIVTFITISTIIPGIKLIIYQINNILVIRFTERYELGNICMRSTKFSNFNGLYKEILNSEYFYNFDGKTSAESYDGLYNIISNKVNYYKLSQKKYIGQIPIKNLTDPIIQNFINSHQDNVLIKHNSEYVFMIKEKFEESFKEYTKI
jgi:hypothetical protein